MCMSFICWQEKNEEKKNTRNRKKKVLRSIQSITYSIKDILSIVLYNCITVYLNCNLWLNNWWDNFNFTLSSWYHLSTYTHTVYKESRFININVLEFAIKIGGWMKSFMYFWMVQFTILMANTNHSTNIIIAMILFLRFIWLAIHLVQDNISGEKFL